MNNVSARKRTPRAHLKRVGLLASALGLVAALSATATGAAAVAAPVKSHAATVTLRVALESNPDMTVMAKLTPYFEKENPGIKVVYDTLPEGQERELVETDITTHANEFNLVMISNYETPIWAKDGWLVDLDPYTAADPSYDVSDLVKPIADSLKYNGALYGVPFYGESSFTMYRKDLFAAAGLTMPLHPTWTQIAAFAKKLNNPSKGIAGICLRGASGWGDNLAPLDTVINTFGGSWFNMKWQPQLTSAADETAVNFYVNLVRKYGEPGASNDSNVEVLTNYGGGRCAMLIDATSMAGSFSSALVAKTTGYAYAPTGPSGLFGGWLYTWSLSIPAGSSNEAAAWKFLSWATGKQEILLSGEKYGWAQIPPGSRVSTYKLPQYQKAAGVFANLTLKSMQLANPYRSTVKPVPYVGVQFVDIPQFVALGTEVSNQISAAIAGSESVSQALSTSQQDAVTIAKQAGLLH
jgi:sorbitol/mannitol transport system substrate-binding protein